MVKGRKGGRMYWVWLGGRGARDGLFERCMGGPNPQSGGRDVVRSSAEVAEVPGGFRADAMTILLRERYGSGAPFR